MNENILCLPKPSCLLQPLSHSAEVSPQRPLREFFSVNEDIGRSRQALEQRVERIRQRSGLLKPVYPHCLRATFATRLAERGMSAPSLAYLMGWEGLQVAEAYIQSSMRRAHEEMRELVLAT